MGVVYRAYHAQLERTGAVKVLQALSPDEETTARFRREAQAIAHLRHPNIVNVFDFGEFEGVPYMIVEYVEGGSLSGRITHAELTPAQALHYLRGIGSALDYAHSLGIVHRDVKPANVLLGTDDTPILADFGLAKLLQSSSIKSITGVTTGTPAYMAPEQVTGSEVGPAADRYSLAVMAFEMLAGSLPFDEAGVLEVLYAHVHREPPHPSTRNAALTNRVDAIIARGLEKNPASRWESCEEFVAALERALLPATPEAERTVAYATATPAVASTTRAAPPLPAVAAVAATAVAVAERPRPATATMMAPLDAPVAAAEPEPKKKRRRALLWIGAAALILLLLIGGTAAFIVGRAPSIDLSEHVLARGDFVTVTAVNIPANQTGELQLHSVIHTFDFRANSSGKLNQLIRIPFDVDLGDHRLDLCWKDVCRASTQLRVVAGGGGVALASPSPTASGGGSPAATPSPSTNPTPGSTPAPGKSPKPTSNPTSNPTHNPSPGPSPRPSPSPSPRPSPSPSPSPTCPFSGASITESPNPVTGGSNVTINGSNFAPGTVTVQYYAGSTLTSTKTATAGANCSFSTTVTTKSAGLLGSRTDKVVACDSRTRCASVTFKTQNLL
jgi:eukaryotic-like serine/threonine-protein kinase